MEESHDFQFVLPLNASDLINSSGDQYYVKEIFGAQEIPVKLQGKFPFSRLVFKLSTVFGRAIFMFPSQNASAKCTWAILFIYSSTSTCITRSSRPAVQMAPLHRI